MEQEQQRDQAPPRAHHQPLHIIFRGGATSYFLRLEATIKTKNRPIELIPRVMRHVPIGSSVGRLENG